MTLLVQLTDTHIVPPGELLYGKADTALHLRQSVQQVNAMQPQPDLILITGDLVEEPDHASYRNFAEIIQPLRAPVRLLPGNHDDPQMMYKMFGQLPIFPAAAPTFQYVVEDFDVRILVLNSHFAGSELPSFGPRRLAWLQQQLEASDKPTLIAIHHPPMKTGIAFIDLAHPDWFAGIAKLVDQHPQVRLVVSGHGHTDLLGRMGCVPVYMAGSTAHQLIAARVEDRAPAFDASRVPPVLHHWLGDAFVSGSDPWPAWVEAARIDKESGLDWEALKDQMRGTMR